MTGATFIQILEEITGLAETGLKTAAGFDPILEIPVEIADAVVPVLEQLIEKAVTAYSGASGTPITVASLTALLPDMTPLNKPTS